VIDAVRLGWSQHADNARAFAAADPADQGAALALMGVALLMLAQDLLIQELPITVVVD